MSTYVPSWSSEGISSTTCTSVVGGCCVPEESKCVVESYFASTSRLYTFFNTDAGTGYCVQLLMYIPPEWTSNGNCTSSLSVCPTCTESHNFHLHGNCISNHSVIA